jgi:hypothetical protein
MYGTFSITHTQHQATVPSRVFWVILDYIALCNHLADSNRLIIRSGRSICRNA